MSGAVEQLRHTYANRDEAARAWKAKGGKVVGYFEDNVPEELIIAAGYMPYRISGDPHQPRDTLKQYLYPYWKKHGLSDRQVYLGFTMSMLDLIFRGRYDFVDHLVIPFSRKGVLAYWYQLSAAKEHHPDLNIPTFWFLDRAITPGFDSSMFNAARVVGLKEQLETWSGKPIATAAVAEAITLTNAIREALARLKALRVEGRVSGTDALALIGAGKMTPPADYLALLDAANAELATAPVRAGKRIFLAGSPQDNDQLYRLIEADGTTIVGENHYWGNPGGEYPVDTEMDPLVAVGDMYHKKPASVLYPIQAQIDLTVKRATEVKADGVIVSIYDHDNLEIWLVPDTIDALKEVGLETLYLSQQPYLIEDPAAITAQVQPFIASLGGAK